MNVSDASSKINSFISAIDAGGASITVKQPPTSVSDKIPTSGLWCVSTTDSLTVLQRLTFTATLGKVIDKLVSWISTEIGVELEARAFPDLPSTSITFSISSTTIYPVDDGASPESTAMASFAIDMGRLRLCVDLTASSAELSLIPIHPIDLVSMAKTAFQNAADTPADSMPDADDGSDPVVKLLGNLIRPWYLQVGFNSQVGARGTLTWGVGALVIISTSRGGPIIFGLAYDSAQSRFSGELLTRSYFLDPQNLRSLTYDARFSTDDIVLDALPVPGGISGIEDGVDLWALVAPDHSPPNYIPHLLSNCNVALTRTKSSDVNKSSTFSFTATLKAFNDETKPSNDGTDGGAPTGFAWTDATIRTTMESTSGKPTTYEVSISSNFTLTPSDGDAGVRLWASLVYHSSKASWLVTAGVKNLSVGSIASFFDSVSQEGAMAVLDKLTLRSLNMRFAHTRGQASSFWIYGVLVLGELELDLSYQYVGKNVGANDKSAYQVVTSGGNGEGEGDNDNDNDGDDGGGDGASDLPKDLPSEILKGDGEKSSFLFEASLRTTSAASTLGSIMDSIVPGSSSSLPGFVSGIPVDPTGAGSTPLARLVFHNDGAAPTLSVVVDIAGFSFTFVQFKTVQDGKTPASTKRILRFECDKIPLIDKVPVINELPQPFDSLDFVWVADNQTVAEKKGITKGDLQNLPKTVPPIQYMQAKKDEQKTDIVLAVGHHFIVVANGKVVLDHIFGSAAAAPAKDASQTPVPHILLAGPQGPLRLSDSQSSRIVSAAEDPSKDEDQSTEAKPTKGAAVLQVGPLSVTAIGLQVVSGHLLVSLDATLKIGGMSMSVLGFTIGIDLSTIKLNDLKSLTLQGVGKTLEKLKVSLNGLAVGLERGPLTLAGVFEHKDDPVAEIYRGGIAVAFEAWQVLAIGEYKIVHAIGAEGEYRAVFVYGKLDGPLVELEFATISGVRLGFGYNYTVRLPTINELYQFPFISDSVLNGAGNDPMAVLAAMTGAANPFVYAKQNSLWFCAGMSIKAFDMLTLTAVLLFDITTASSGGDQAAGAVMALLADGVFEMEPEAPPDESLFYIEVVIKMEFNFIQGYIGVDAALAPASHVYVPEAHLTGQASFYYWFGPNLHAGDWVVSIGGYARSYTAPSHYPNPERLGLSFCVGDGIQIVGTGYVAVTPKCAMAGGTLHLSLSTGPVSAYADVVMDAFINFKPFHFHAFIGLSVGVECEIDILFIHIHISVHLGADLVLWGPHDFGGRAHVYFWFFGFDISFGADENTEAKNPIDLCDFVDLVRSPGPASEARTTDQVSSSPAQADVAIHKWTVEQGLLPAKTPPPAQDGSYPSTGTNTEWHVAAATLVIRVDTVFALKEAQFATGEAGKTIPIGPIDPTTAGSIYAMPMHSLTAADSALTITVAKDGVVQSNWRAEVVTKSVPSAIWSHAKWESANDPLSVQDGAPPPANVTDGTKGATVDLVFGVRLLAPEPVRARSHVVQFDIAAAMVKHLPATRDVVAEDEDRVFEAALYEPSEPDQTKRWDGFGAVMTRTTNAAGEQLDVVRAAMTEAVSDAMEWAIRPVSAGSVDADRDFGWKLKGVSLGALAGDIADQWGALPLVSAVG